MTNEPAPKPNAITPEMLRTMAAAVGVSLTGDRASALAPQAEQHFGQLRYLEDVVNPSIEPAAEFCPDRWTNPGRD